ncbi:MAG: EVE domain-containing protein [Candidatus Verstraetearchaeota archaeon]|nr:EVE domain-containing protein [Candidatus Verstraetearchaeota archaeon]
MTYSFVEVVMPKFWIASGPPEYWKVAFEIGKIWGVTNGKFTQWKKLSSGDYILFYANKPVSGVIGYGVVRTKFRQDKPLWPREIEERRVIWPYRFEFDVEYCLPQDEWEKRRVTSNYIAGARIGGLKQIREEEARKIISELVPAKPPSPLDGINSIENSLKKVLESAKLSFSITHECVELMLLRIGKQLGFHTYTADPSRTCDNISLKELADMDKDYLKRYAGDQFLE